MHTDPSGKPVAMAHSNTCTSDLNAWNGLFREFVDAQSDDAFFLAEPLRLGILPTRYVCTAEETLRLHAALKVYQFWPPP